MKKAKKTNIFERSSNQIGMIYDLLKSENQNVKIQEIDECWKQTNQLIDQLVDSKKNISTDQLKGFYAEVFHSGTFNIDAASKGISDRTWVPSSTKLGSADIKSSWGEDYQVKYYKSAEKSFNAQMEGEGESLYKGHSRLIPSDQTEDATKFAEEKINRNLGNRPEVSERAAETRNVLKDKISHEGAESTQLSEKDAKKWAEKAKNGNVEHISRHEDLTWQSQAKDALQSAGEAAIVSMVISSTPTILKGCKKLWKDPDYDNGKFLNDFKEEIKNKTIQRGSDTFVKSSVASSIIISARNGVLGESMKSLSPAQAAMISQVAVESAKAILRWQKGEITAEEAASETTKATLRVAASMAGKAIGTAIPIPVLGSIIGSYIASSGVELFIGKVETPSSQIILRAMSIELQKHTELIEMCSRLEEMSEINFLNYAKAHDINLDIVFVQSKSISSIERINQKLELLKLESSEIKKLEDKKEDSEDE